MIILALYLAPQSLLENFLLNNELEYVLWTFVFKYLSQEVSICFSVFDCSSQMTSTIQIISQWPYSPSTRSSLLSQEFGSAV